MTQAQENILAQVDQLMGAQESPEKRAFFFVFMEEGGDSYYSSTNIAQEALPPILDDLADFYEEKAQAEAQGEQPNG